ncbi:glycosyltransferase [Paraclostridium bifermentans]|uniref:Glycosyltransferase n=1 Tax=Paraclostridium bifermentans TaxID=1490 RepID=A0AA44DIA2_PARBF|nr:glycosyltransferase family 2 protein [Paraclostridium bifermentans]MBN8047969.1 glycosyltransferase [Paraclostridium bifermentans]NME08195.1 glycosyltransferase [Paraclostridium bifermentans]
MLLSIVMMIRNEERYLDMTLKSLNPLMNNIKSELIILDTGSTDRSVEIAKKYTDKVYFAKWNDNFAQMRNLSIKYASGEWILVLDADEELVNCENLINFFKNRIHKKYNSASVELTNIMSEDKKKFNKASIVRLFKRDKNFRYEGAIHEQPIYKEPIFSDIANFNHYGYMYKNEEVKQKKLGRNEKILLSELKSNPNNPYIYYQLAMNYSAFGEKKEALSYMEKCYEINNKLGVKYSYVSSGLAKLYLELDEYEECEKLCKEYIKNDDKNIDIYFYIAISQNNLKNYEESLYNYKRYLYLIENYEISTQANDLYSICDTISFRENAKIDILNIYYNLGMYEKVIADSNNIDLEQLKQIYYVLIMSLYKLEREDELFNIYEKISLSQVEKNIFEENIEDAILNIKQSDRFKIYNTLTKIDGNYGILNKIRLGMKLSDEEYNEILLEENELYYADIIYYALKSGSDLVKLLAGVNHVSLNKYFGYLVLYRRDCILELYDYLVEASNTMDLNKIIIYRCLSKYLLFDEGLKGKKYEQLIYMYLAYSYVYIKQIYNELLSDEELLRLVNDEDNVFIIKLNSIEKLKKNNPVEYIKNMRQLLIENKKYKSIISILINNFKSEIEENEELKNLKKQYKEIIKSDVNKGYIKDAQIKINEYQSLFKFESEILNLKAITKILSLEYIEADYILKQAYIIDRNNYDVIFNIACVKEMLGEFSESIKYLDYIIKNCDDETIVCEAKEKLRENMLGDKNE